MSDKKDKLPTEVLERIKQAAAQNVQTNCFLYKESEQVSLNWPRMILAGPVERAPVEIAMRGFQGFRYVTRPLW